MKGPVGDALRLYLRGHLFPPVQAAARAAPGTRASGTRRPHGARQPARQDPRRGGRTRQSQRPVLVIGSQTLVNQRDPGRIASAIPGSRHPHLPGWDGAQPPREDQRRQFRHERGKALRRADLVIVAGFPFDFRLKYGQAIPKRQARRRELERLPLRRTGSRTSRFAWTRRDAGRAGGALATFTRSKCLVRDAPRPRGEAATPRSPKEDAPRPRGRVSPLRFLLELEKKLADDAILVADGGDFVGTASVRAAAARPARVARPRCLRDPGRRRRFRHRRRGVPPEIRCGSCGATGRPPTAWPEFDTFVRHGLAPIAVIGNDAAWMQIARDQVGPARRRRRHDAARYGVPRGREGLWRRRPADRSGRRSVKSSTGEEHRQKGRPCA